MKKVIAYLRIKEWLSSKVTMMMGIFIYFAYLNNCDVFLTLIEGIIYFLFVSSFLAISYIANDYSDIEVDKKVGKYKVIATMKKWQIWLSFIVLFIVGNGPLLFITDKRSFTAVMIVVTYILGLAYSTLGIRFKEKGVWGLIECSFAQKSIPLVTILALMEFSEKHFLLLLCWMLISFFDGIRYIVIHQIVDLENDRKSGVITYVSQKISNYRKLLKSLLFVIVIGTLLMLYPIINEHFLISALFISIFTMLEYGIYKVLCLYAKKDWYCTFDSVPFESFLNCGMPLLVGICSTFVNYYMWFYVLVIMVISFKSMIVKWRIAKPYYFRQERKKG